MISCCLSTAVGVGWKSKRPLPTSAGQIIGQGLRGAMHVVHAGNFFYLLLATMNDRQRASCVKPSQIPGRGWHLNTSLLCLPSMMLLHSDKVWLYKSKRPNEGTWNCKIAKLTCQNVLILPSIPKNWEINLFVAIFLQMKLWLLKSRNLRQNQKSQIFPWCPLMKDTHQKIHKKLINKGDLLPLC